MRDEDDDLRAALHRERLAGDSPFDARAAFAAVQPRLARARRRRTAARSAAAAVLLLVGLGITLAASDTSDQEIHMSDRNTDRTSGPTSVVPHHADAIAPSTSSTTTPQSGATTSTTAARQVALPTTTARAAIPDDDSNDDSDDDSDDDPDDDSTDPPTPGGTAATTPPSPGIEPSTSAAPTTTAAPSTTTSTTTSTTSASTTSTTAPLAAPELFTCECGSALVDRSTGTVVVLQVDADPGYSYRLEHREEDGSQTIEFTGVGEECELRIPVSGRAWEDD